MSGELETARRLQFACNEIISGLCSTSGNMYAVIKETLRRRKGLMLGSVRAPLAPINDSCSEAIDRCCRLIDDAVHTFCG